MRVLVTSSRLPFALDMIRKLAERGHEVYASDCYELAPGSHSRHLAGHFVTASPADATESFVGDVERVARENEIDIVVPAFEEAFYLATQRERIAAITNLYAAPFRTLAQLHDKGSFRELAVRLGLPTPETVVATSDAGLRAALDRYPRYFARAAFSRGGVALLTNTGPLAGHVSVEDCRPTPTSPWLVQPFVDGPMRCTYSTLHDGRVTAHCEYAAPRQWEHSTGIQFLSVDASGSLDVVARLGAELSYTGQMSLDFVAAPEGLKLIECNPRATDGVLLMTAEELEAGLLGDDGEVTVVEPGRETQLDLALVGQLLSERPGEMPASVSDLLRVRGSDRGWHDALPKLYSFLAFAHHERLSLGRRQQLFVAMSDGICWDGQPIAGMSAGDAGFLAELTSTPAAR
jgi:hypothetical protein